MLFRSVSFHLASLNTGSPSWLEPRLQPRHLAYLGLRDVETAEREVIRDLGIAAYYTQDIDRLGVVGAVRESLARVDPEGTRKIHLSFDIDVLCPLEAPREDGGARLALDGGEDNLEELHRADGPGR